MKPQVLLIALIATTASASSLDVVRTNFVDYYTAAGADRSRPRMVTVLNDLEREASADSALLRSDGSFSDINYGDIPSGSWSPWDHFRRLTVMAKAYRTPGQRLYNDPQLRAQIESALAYVPSFYGVFTLPLGNWWFWTIGAPLDLGPTLVLMRGDIRQSVYDDCVRTLYFHVGASPTAKGLVGPTPVGENLVWSAYTHLCVALLRDDEGMLAAVRDAMITACATTTDDGIQPDNSFHQHGAQLYTGGYGGSFANSVAQYLLLTRGATPPFRALPSLRSRTISPTAWRGRCIRTTSTSRWSAAKWRDHRPPASTASQRSCRLRRSSCRDRTRFAPLPQRWCRRGAHYRSSWPASQSMPRRRGPPVISITSIPTTQFIAAPAGSPR